MRIIGSATYMQDRARRRLGRGLVLLIGGLALCAAAFLGTLGLLPAAPNWLGGLPAFVGLGGALVGALQLAAASRDHDLSVGEGPVVAQLQARFGDEYVYLRRLTLPRDGAEADGVLLGPHGALVLAIRAADAQLLVRGDDWYTQERSGERRLWSRSPSWEVARPVRALARLSREQGLDQVPVQGAVVLVQARLLEADRPGTAVVPSDRIAAYVQYLQPKTPVPQQMIEQLTDALAPHAGGVDTRPKDRR